MSDDYEKRNRDPRRLVLDAAERRESIWLTREQVSDLARDPAFTTESVLRQRDYEKRVAYESRPSPTPEGAKVGATRICIAGSIAPAGPIGATGPHGVSKVEARHWREAIRQIEKIHFTNLDWAYLERRATELAGGWVMRPDNMPRPFAPAHSELSERMRLADEWDGPEFKEACDYANIGNGMCTQLRADEAELARKDAEIAGLRERVQKYRERLEVTHHYTLINGKPVRVECDGDEKYDGIYCRNETIKLAQQCYDEMKARAEAAEAELARLRAQTESRAADDQDAGGAGNGGRSA